MAKWDSEEFKTRKDFVVWTKDLSLSEKLKQIQLTNNMQSLFLDNLFKDIVEKINDGKDPRFVFTDRDTLSFLNNPTALFRAKVEKWAGENSINVVFILSVNKLSIEMRVIPMCH